MCPRQQERYFSVLLQLQGNLTNNGAGGLQPAAVVVPGVGAGSGPLVVAPHTSLPPPVVVGLPWSPGGELLILKQGAVVRPPPHILISLYDS